ncbi:MAG: hypothetical protein PHU04_01445 [Candidatus Peribacteraceae bacterium]|nr:hypothetical protein [Candidatus Peribacteraceae bacterium]
MSERSKRRQKTQRIEKNPYDTILPGKEQLSFASPDSSSFSPLSDIAAPNAETAIFANVQAYILLALPTADRTVFSAE